MVVLSISPDSKVGGRRGFMSPLKRSASAVSRSTTSSKRQKSLASFFTKSPAKAPASSSRTAAGIRKAEKEIIDLASPPPEDSTIQNADSELDLGVIEEKPYIEPVSAPIKARLPSPDTSIPYPPADHASYRLPPDPTYNHPTVISPLPSSLSLSFNKSPRVILKPPLGLDLLYFDRFVDPSCSRQLFKYLLDAMPWYRVRYTVRGIHINTPRWTTVFGKDSSGTPWTGYQKCQPRAIPEILLTLMQRVEQVTDETYNFVLVNFYENGSDSISYHSDSEKFLGQNPCIASLSLGGGRDFMLRHVKYKELGTPVEKFVLQSGDMVVMRGRTQHDWQHTIPKRASAQGRINITFRKGIVPYATQNYYTYNVGDGPVHRWSGKEMVPQD